MKQRCNNEKAITLIALVVTVIVLIILGGISIHLILGNNGVITKAEDAKEQHKISELEERLELDKGPVSIQNRGEVQLSKYIDYIKGKENLTDSDFERIDSKNYYVTLEDDYVFLLEELDNQDVKITYKGTANRIGPAIAKVTGISTSNSISVTTVATRADGGTYKFYIKREKSDEYGSAVGSNKTGEYTFSNLEQNHIFYIQVELTTENGTATKEISITTKTIEALTQDNVTFVSTPSGDWTNGKVTTTMTVHTNEYIVQYSKDLVNWNVYATGQKIESTKNENIYVRLTDGKNVGEYATHIIDNIDTDKPQNAVVTFTSGAGEISTTGTATVTATIKHIDQLSGVQIDDCKWVLTNSASALGENASSYTGTFTSNNQQISFKVSAEGSYYVHVLTVDKAGNKKETISSPVKMTANKHVHTGSSSTGGGCYTSPVYHTHTGSSSSGGGCYTVAVYHTHSGSPTTGGGCYTTAITHTHTDACYNLGTCNKTTGDYGYITGRQACGWCGNPDSVCKRSFKVYHSACGSATEWREDWACGNSSCGYSIQKRYQGTHTYRKSLKCTIAEGITGYSLGCGKDTTTVESYDLGCGLSDTTPISYNLGCGYEVNQITSYTISY